MWDDGRQMPWSETPKMRERLSRHVHSVDRAEDGEGRQAAALADLFQSRHGRSSALP